MDNLENELKKYYGFDSFRPGQKEVIEILCEGRSALAVFPTGQGKSLCYQLSAVLLEGTALIVSPLLALMKDQVDFLQSKNIPSARLDSSLEPDVYRETIKNLKNGSTKLLYVSPERFANEKFIQMLGTIDISFMVIDEAHCISEWGHNFRPDYLKLTHYAEVLNITQFLTLTATATPSVVADIKKTFSIADSDYIHTGFYRPNLKLLYSPSPLEDRLNTLLVRIKNKEPGATIIYATKQTTTEEIAAFLNQYGLKTEYYHAGMETDARERVQSWFMDSEKPIVVATIAFGMGIDKSNIRYVYHYNIPKSLENYSQEIGRAGRDGNPSICEVIGDHEDLGVLQNFVYGDTPDQSNLENALRDIVLSEDAHIGISIYKLGHAHDIKPLVLSTLLTYLELEGFIRSTGAYYTEYKFKPLKPSSEMLSRFKGERAAFLRRLFRLAIPKKIWFEVDIDHAVSSLHAPREKIVSTLSWLEEHQYIELKTARLQQGYDVVKTVSESEVRQLVQSMTDRFEKREVGDIKRLELVTNLIYSEECQVNQLLSYFGEKRKKDCGHCGVCCEENEIQSYEADEIELDSTHHKIISSTAESNNYESLKTPRSIARFLCGISSPVISAKRLAKHKSFGSLKELSFKTVLEWIEENDLKS